MGTVADEVVRDGCEEGTKKKSPWRKRWGGNEMSLWKRILGFYGNNIFFTSVGPEAQCNFNRLLLRLGK